MTYRPRSKVLAVFEPATGPGPDPGPMNEPPEPLPAPIALGGLRLPSGRSQIAMILALGAADPRSQSVASGWRGVPGMYLGMTVRALRSVCPHVQNYHRVTLHQCLNGLVFRGWVETLKEGPNRLYKLTPSGFESYAALKVRHKEQAQQAFHDAEAAKHLAKADEERKKNEAKAARKARKLAPATKEIIDVQRHEADINAAAKKASEGR